MSGRRAFGGAAVRAAGTLVIGAWMAVITPACTAPGDGAPPANWNPSDPFGPAYLRIYPLTHVERGGSGPARLVCHLEFTDRWFDTTKAWGRVEISLYRAGPSTGTDQQNARWEIDLADLNRNADWFDPVTRTYRIQLDLPAWADQGPGTEFRLHAAFTPPGAAGATIRDDFVLKG